jgi:PmbA protein
VSLSDEFDPQRALAIAESILDRAEGDEELEVGVGLGSDTEVRAYGGEIESLSAARGEGLFIRVIVDGRQGTASASSLDEAVIAEVLAEARDNSRYASPDPLATLAVPDGVAPPDLDFFDPTLLDHPVEAKLALALELERAVMAGDRRIIGLDGGADYGESIAVGALASTAGIRAAGRETSAGLSVFALAGDGEEVQVGFGCSVGRGPNELDLVRCAADAVGRATRMLGAVKPATARLPVIFDPWVTAQFVGLVAEMLSGEAVLKGRSPFVGREGTMIGARSVTLIENPTDPLAYGASRTDDEGLASRPVELIGAGSLKGFLHNSYTARALGATSTGSAVRSGGGRPVVGPRAVSLAPGSASAAEIIAGVGDGLLVQEVSGLHSGVNPVSGDFSTGIEGVMVRNGELAEPVREAIIASTLQRMLTEITAVGNDVEYFPMEASGVTVAFDELTLSGA